METVPERAQAVLRLIGRAVAWIVPAVAVLLWIAVFGLLRLGGAAKRVVVCSALATLACLWGLTRLPAAPSRGLTTLLALALGVSLMVAGSASWVEYRDKLRFLARTQLHGRRIHAGPDWWSVWRRQAAQAEGRGQMVLAVLLALVVVRLLWVADMRMFATVADVVLTLAAVAFAWQTVVLVRVERRERAAFYHRGWPVPDPVAVEQRLVQRIPFVGWREPLGRALRPVARWMEAAVAAPERCVG